MGPTVVNASMLSRQLVTKHMAMPPPSSSMLLNRDPSMKVHGLTCVAAQARGDDVSAHEELPSDVNAMATFAVLKRKEYQLEHSRTTVPYCNFRGAEAYIGSFMYHVPESNYHPMYQVQYHVDLVQDLLATYLHGAVGTTRKPLHTVGL